jgi:hypothetical protein
MITFNIPGQGPNALIAINPYLVRAITSYTPDETKIWYSESDSWVVVGSFQDVRDLIGDPK